MTPDHHATATSFRSILFVDDALGTAAAEEPEFFGDLNLDQIVTAVTAGREEYGLAPIFYCPLHDVEAVLYRHHTLRDLERESALEAVLGFAEGMRQMRNHLAVQDKLYHALQKQRWFLEALITYCRTVAAFAERLADVDLRSRGFVGLREYLTAHVASERFTSLVAETQGVVDALGSVSYSVHIRGSRVRVSRYDGEPDMSEQVDRIFAKFKQAPVTDYRVNLADWGVMNHVEGRILDLVAQLHPDAFVALEQCCARNQGYLDETVDRFDREVQFYLAYLEHIAPLKANGLAFSYPRVSSRSKHIRATGMFDLALATKLTGDNAPVVTNDFHVTDVERVLVVSGPNNGGKTTFARAFGQLHYLASLGLPIAGAEARLFLADRIFTHFEREEEIETLRGKFEDELFRIHEILKHATGDSMLIMNESFGSTTLRDALVVGTEVMRRIIDLDALCVFVTFVDELSRLGPSTVSMMSTVVPDDPAVRTYKVMRKRADGLAYAAAIAEKYGLTYEALRERIAR